MPNQATLLQYHVVRNWAQEIISDIDRGATIIRATNDKSEASDAMLNVREKQLRVIEILNDLVAGQDHQIPDQV